MRALIIRTLLAVTLAAGAMALLPAEETVGERPSGKYGFPACVSGARENECPRQTGPSVLRVYEAGLFVMKFHEIGLFGNKKGLIQEKLG